MQLSLHLSLFYFLCVVFQQDLHNGVVHAAVEEKPCKSVLGELTRKQLNGISGCTKALKLKSSKEKAAKQICILKCVLKKENFITQDGQASQELFDKFVDANIPPSLYGKVNETFRGCLEDHPLDDNEEYCKDYTKMVRCLFDTLPSMCK